MTTEPIEHVMAALVRDFLATDESQAAGVPTWPIRAMEDMAEVSLPAVVVTGEQTAGVRRRVVSVVVRFEGSVGSGDGQTTAALAKAGMAAIEERLQDRPAWSDWLGSLAISRRTGYQIMRRVFVPPPAVEREESGALMLSVAMEMFVRV